MKNLGILGFPRLTSAGPLVNRYDINLSASDIDQDEVEDLMIEVFQDLDIDPRDMSDDEIIAVADRMTDLIYPTARPVDVASRRRFKKCLASKWAQNWTDGLIETSQMPDTEYNRLLKRIIGCIGITDSNTAKNEELIPNIYKD